MSAGAGIRRSVVARALFMHSLLRKAGWEKTLEYKCDYCGADFRDRFDGQPPQKWRLYNRKDKLTGNRDRRAVDSVESNSTYFMRSALCVSASLFAAILLKFTKKKPVTSVLPKGFVIYHFNCWLCSGDTAFGCMPSGQDKHFDFDCCRCGVENRVLVKSPVSKT